MEVSFEKEGKRMTLTGGKETGSCKMTNGRRLPRMLKGKWNQLAHLFSIVAIEEAKEGQKAQGEMFLIVSTPQDMANQVYYLRLT